MIIDHGGLELKLLGDPHLGKRFVQNVPLHRRGEREAIVWQRFEDEFSSLQGVDYHICMGDLFDHTQVSLDTILRAFRVYQEASTRCPDVEFIIIRGNHDKGRDASATTAYDIFCELTDQAMSNIFVLQNQLWAVDGLAFIPWHPTIPAVEMLSELVPNSAEVVFGHWDTDPRVDPHNLIPTAALAARGVKYAYTGHVHLPTTFTRDGVEVIGTGSMLPYAHGEGDPYITLSLEEARARDDLLNKCVRLDLQPGEKLDFTLDCLQLQVRHVSPEVDLEDQLHVTLGDFSLTKIFDDVAKDIPLPPEIEKELRAKWQTISTQAP